MCDDDFIYHRDKAINASVVRISIVSSEYIVARETNEVVVRSGDIFDNLWLLYMPFMCLVRRIKWIFFLYKLNKKIN